MRSERKHVTDVPEEQKEEGRTAVQQKLKSTRQFPKPYQVIIGEAKTKRAGYVGIYIELLASTH